MSFRRSVDPLLGRSVFINCPFDVDYRPLMRAACFTILSCGLSPRCALDLNDSGVVRFTETVKMIAACDFSIHDISRVELEPTSSLPRFNMPLELGADLGLRLAGPSRQRRRRTLVLDSEPHRYDKTLSDISGMDIEVHQNDARMVIRRVRDWLNAHRATDVPPFPGATAVNEDYESYLRLAPDIIAEFRLDPHDHLPHGDFLLVVGAALPLIEAARNA